MTAQPDRTCTVCSLLCPLDTATSGNQASQCQLRTSWLSRFHPAQLTAWQDASRSLSSIRNELRAARHPLIWVDGADVETMRCVVRLAAAWQATIVVPKQTGAKHITSITCNDGWLGTTLADAAEHSQLVIALGSRWINDLPRLKERFFSQRADQVWWQIQATSGSAGSSAQSENQHISYWPRKSWPSRIGELIQQLNQGTAMNLDSLANRILRSNYTTILWEKSELAEPEDEFLIYQLNQLAKLRSQSARCCLLPLDCNTGTETASAALLWLTGCSDIAQPKQESWISPAHYQDYSINDWLCEFDFVVRISNTASRQTCDIPANLSITDPTQHDLSPVQRRSAQAGNADVAVKVSATIKVGVAGMHHDAILFRGDHGLTCFAPKDLDACTNQEAVSSARVLQLMQALIQIKQDGEL